MEALAREVNGRVEVRSWVQDSEGRWGWSNYAAQVGRGTWSPEFYDDQVKVEARIVSEWEPVDRRTIPDDR